MTSTACYNIGPDQQFTINIVTDPSKGDAGKYCMYMSAGFDCLCNTETFELDLSQSIRFSIACH